MGEKKFDLILFGATGFTGKQTLLHLAQWVPAKFKWGIAGRSRDKLNALLPLCESAAVAPSVVVADASDADAVDSLVASSRVIVQLAGPYSEHGELFIASAAKHGTHYLDLSGEIGWVRSMIDRYHDQAVASKAKIVPVSGFEALPFDLGALFVAQKLYEETGERATQVEVNVGFRGPPAFRPRDVLSGGTMASIKAMLQPDHAGSLDMLSDPAILVAEERVAERIREAHPYQLRERYDESLSSWLAPTVPAPFVNPPVVYRSMGLLASSKTTPFAADCGYREAMLMKSFFPVSVVQRILAGVISGAFIAVVHSSRRNSKLDQTGRALIRQVLDLIGPTSGQGPSEKHLNDSGYVLHMSASAASGASVVARATASGHPGYKSTAMLIAEAGLALAGSAAPGGKALPRRYGVITPVAAFGLSAQPSWERAGLRFDP
jgi:short subunit dehydrogenase-like uncharacterized protein